MPLEAANITAAYSRGAGNAILHDVTAQIERGQVTVLLGSNGSGKSTLMRCLARALPPMAGQVRIDGADMYTLSARKAAQALAYVGQENLMPFAFTVQELVLLGAEAGKGPESAEARTEQALQQMEIAALKHRSVVTLSGGERQRAAIARALAQNADYLLLDEPTAHLDLRHQEALLHAARYAAHQAGKGVLLVLHDLNAAAVYADTILLMSRGKIVIASPPEQALTAENIRIAYDLDVTIRRARPDEESVPDLWIFAKSNENPSQNQSGTTPGGTIE